MGLQDRDRDDYDYWQSRVRYASRDDLYFEDYDSGSDSARYQARDVCFYDAHSEGKMQPRDLSHVSKPRLTRKREDPVSVAAAGQIQSPRDETDVKDDVGAGSAF